MRITCETYRQILRLHNTNEKTAGTDPKFPIGGGAISWMANLSPKFPKNRMKLKQMDPWGLIP